MRMRPFAKRFIALSLCAGLVLTGTGGTTAGQMEDIEILSTETQADSEALSEDTAQDTTDVQALEVVQEEETSDTETPESIDADTEAIEEDTQQALADQEEELTEEDTETEADTEIEAETETEENTESDAEPETEADTELEEEKLQTLTYEDDTVIVSVSAAEGVIPENASLSVTPIEKDTDEYNDVAADLQDNADEQEYALLGFLAYDICFVNEDGEEVEPNGDVTVSMEYINPVLPEEIEDAENADVTVMHLAETDAGIVVEDLTENSTIVTNEQQEVTNAEFTSDNFSTYTIMWTKNDNNYSITIKYVDSDYFSIYQPEENVKIELDEGEVCTFADHATEISDYSYSYATYGNSSSNKVKTAKLITDTNQSKTTTSIKYYNYSLGKDTEVSGTGSVVYLVYEADNLIDTVDTTSKGVTINLFDYKVNTSGNINQTYSTLESYSGAGSDNGINKDHALKFLSYTQDTNNLGKINQYKSQNIYQGIVQSLLGEDNYPVLSTLMDSNGNQSLSYLFDTNSTDNVKSTYLNCNYLFSYDNATGYYSYDSSEHFATIARSGSETAQTQITTETSDDEIKTSYVPSSYNFKVYSGQGDGFYPFTYYSNSPYGQASGHGTEYGIDTLGTTNLNHYFGMTITTNFVQPQNGMVNNNDDMTFQFGGDDDVWVYIDDVLVLDIGGIHSQTYGTIDFADGSVKLSFQKDLSKEDVFDNNTGNSIKATTIKTLFDKAYESDETYNWKDIFVENTDDDGNGLGTYRFKDFSEHTLRFFYLERGANTSNCYIKFNLPPVPAGSLVAGKTVTGLESNDGSEYEFTLFDKTTNTAKEGYSYKLYGGTNPSSGTVKMTGSGGKFTLKDGEYAVFENLDTNHVYTVTETGVASSEYKLDRDFYTYATYYDESGKLISDRKYSADLTINAASSVSVSFLNAKIPVKDLPLEKSKYVKVNENHTYDLTLEISGKTTIRSDKDSEAIDADIVIVSGSTQIETEMVTAIADRLASLHPIVVSNFAVVSLDTGGIVKQKDEDWTSVYQDNNAKGGVVTITTPPATSNGSANYAKALETAAELLKNGSGKYSQDSADPKKVLILVGDENVDNVDTLENIISNLGDEVDFVYAVGYGADGLENLVKNNSPVNAMANYYDGSSSLTTDEIKEAIAKNLNGLYCSNMTVTDTLSEYAEWSTGDDLYLALTVTDASGTSVASVTQNGSSAKTAAKGEGTTIAQVTATIGKADITASLIETMDADGNAVREIVMDFPDKYQLPEGYKYSVTVRIEPTAKAYQTFIDSGYTYTNKGDPDTDAKGNNTSSGKEGFYSNTKATVSYLFGGVKQPLEEYSKPVIQLDAVYVWDFSKISTSRGFGNTVLGLAAAAFTLTDSDNNIKYYGTSTNDGAVEWYENMNMTGSPVSYLDPGTYTLLETQAPTGYMCSDLTWTVTIEKSNKITIQSGETVVSTNLTLPTAGKEGITIVGTNTQATDGKPAIVSYAIYFEDNILYELPSAGGAGIFLFVIAGMLLMMGGALLIFVKRRKVLRI